VLVLKNKTIIGIDLAGKQENPTGGALWKNKNIETRLLFTDNEILSQIISASPTIIAIDAPFSLPKQGLLRTADRKMIQQGYKVFPPKLSAMKKLTFRAETLNKLIAEKGYKTIEVHPTSTRKALGMPAKDYGKIQEIFKQMRLGGTLKTQKLTAHELDAVTAALTAHLHIKHETEAVGDAIEGYIIVPKKQDWRNITI